MSRACITSIVLLTVTIGCAAKRVSSVDPDARARIGYAATTTYPATPRPATTAVLAAAVDYPRLKQIEILNLSDNAIASPTLWVNGAYLRQLATIPPRGAISVRYGGLLQAGYTANDFERAAQPVTKVELHTTGGLYNVLGPAVKR